jgi:hypothetical protein
MSWRYHKGALLIAIAGCFAASAARAAEYQWVMLTPESDSRNADMVEHDDLQSRNTVGVINQNEPLLHQSLVWRRVRIKDLLAAQVPFCEMHFDAVRAVSLTMEDRRILTEYLKRGGFILFFIDAYPYPEEEFWKIKQWPVIDFLTRELPTSDPDFTIGKASDDFPLFKVHYQTQTADAIRHELDGNPNTPNRTLVYDKGRLCCFVMGSYSYLADGVWQAVDKPYPTDFSMELKSYQLIVNVYIYAITD